ncbi:hypothetical protein PUN28_009530 [Cardiocondyla obscurior]|uniref:Uncharacterized protein n=1 Tax=Cardiocondyla obscurior TaxID=286306 RepID=A0AAW2FSL1_9HYME
MQLHINALTLLKKKKRKKPRLQRILNVLSSTRSAQSLNTTSRLNKFPCHLSPLFRLLLRSKAFPNFTSSNASLKLPIINQRLKVVKSRRLS